MNSGTKIKTTAKLMVLLFLMVSMANAQEKTGIPDKLGNEVNLQINNDQERMIDIYKDNHENPELGFMEVRTSGIVAKEQTGVSYKSTKKVLNLEGDEVPVAHLCGHDAHTTWILGMAKAMVELKDYWSGTLVVVGQPSEESIEGATAIKS